MADKMDSDRDETVTGPAGGEEIRGIATDDEDFDSAEELEEDEAEEDEKGNTF